MRPALTGRRPGPLLLLLLLLCGPVRSVTGGTTREARSKNFEVRGTVQYWMGLAVAVVIRLITRRSRVQITPLPPTKTTTIEALSDASGRASLVPEKGVRVQRVVEREATKRPGASVETSRRVHSLVADPSKGRRGRRRRISVPSSCSGGHDPPGNEAKASADRRGLRRRSSVRVFARLGLRRSPRHRVPASPPVMCDGVELPGARFPQAPHPARG